MPYKDKEKQKQNSRENYYKNKEKKLKQAKEYYYKNWERKQEYRKRWIAENLEKVKIYQKKYNKKWSEKNKEKLSATYAIKWAIKSRKIIKPTICEHCKNEFQEKEINGHHYLGYKKKNKLNVIWLCGVCHRKEHYDKN